MAKTARSARGEIVDFDILAIKTALSQAPVSVSTDERRKFIDTKDGIKTKVQNGLVSAPKASLPEAMMVAIQGAEISADVDLDVLAVKEALAQEEVVDLKSIDEEFEQPEE